MCVLFVCVEWSHFLPFPVVMDTNQSTGPTTAFTIIIFSINIIIIQSSLFWAPLYIILVFNFFLLSRYFVLVFYPKTIFDLFFWRFAPILLKFPIGIFQSCLRHQRQSCFQIQNDSPWGRDFAVLSNTSGIVFLHQSVPSLSYKIAQTRLK